MEGWLGDAILESFPSFIVTEEAKRGLLASGVTGAIFADVEVTMTDNFKELYPNRNLPKFAWLKPEGAAGYSDFGTSCDGRLVVSERALNVLRQFGTAHASVEPFNLRCRFPWPITALPNPASPATRCVRADP